MTGRSTEKVIAETERWFLQRGTPHFIEGYSASRDVFTRAAPVLSLVFVFEMLGALNLEWAWWVNLLAVVGGFVLLVGAWALANLVRRRPALSLPREVGRVELAVFVLAPALVPLVFGGQVVSAAVTAGANLALLGAVYVVTSYGLIPMTRWAGAKMFRELGAVAGLVARALPLLLLFVTFLFLTVEVWQVTATLEGPFYAATVALFFLAGTAFLLTRLPAEIDDLARLDGPTVEELCVGTPVASATTPTLDTPPPTGRRQRLNVALVVLVSQAVQVVLVSVVLGLFFVAFGLIAIRPPVVAEWTGQPVDTLVSFGLFDETVVLTPALLRVAGFLTVFSGFYFTVYVITDATYRREFFDEVVAEVRQGFAVRAVYLSLVRAGGPPPSR